MRIKIIQNLLLNFKKTLWPLFVDVVQLSQGYRATTRRQFTFCHSVPRNSRYSTDGPRKEERLSWPWSHPVVLSPGPLDWESSALTLPAPCISESFIKVKINLNFYFHTSLWCLTRFYEGLKGLHKIWVNFFLFVRDRGGKG